jgi:uncharacterized caspase-like protein
MSKRLALIIGNSLYRDQKLSKISSPDADVGALKDALLDPELGGFDDVNLIFNSATHIVRKEIFNFFAKKTSSDMLLFYFTGHGVLDELGRLYLALKDTDTEALRGTAIPARYITEEMDNSLSKRQILILDCCHSGAFERGTKGVTGASVGTASAFEGSGYGRVILTASDATQYAWEGSQVIGEAENSLFTHFIIHGIKTGEADTNRDGNISVDELFDYVYSQIRETTHKQTPGKWSFKEQGEMIISHNPRLEGTYISSETREVHDTLEEVDEDELENQKSEKLEELYSNLISKMLAGQYQDAKEIIFEIQKIDKGYRDIDSLLSRVNILLKEESLRKDQERTERQRREQERSEQLRNIKSTIEVRSEKSYIVGILIQLFAGAGLFYANNYLDRKWFYLFNFIAGALIFWGGSAGLYEGTFDQVMIVTWLILCFLHLVGLIDTIIQIRKRKNHT